MDMQGALRARLLGATAAGSRVYWVDRPQGSALPAITLQVISGDRPQTYDGFQSSRQSRVQMDVWAETHAAGTALLEAAIGAVAPRVTANGIQFDRTFFEGERDTSERLGTANIYRAGIDLLVRHSPA